MEHQLALLIAVVAVVGVAAQWIAWLSGLPAIVVLLVTGLVAGPVTGLFDPSHHFGEFLRPAISLAVAIIVFEGGFNLNFRELRQAGAGVFRLVAFGLPLSWAFGTLAGHYIGGLSWSVATLYGAILVVTGPTVIIPLLRQAKLQRRPASLLKWEGIVNDPIGAVLAIVILEYLILTSAAPTGNTVVSDLALHLASGIGVAVAFGLGLPFLIRWAFQRDLAPEFLKTPILLAAVLGITTASNAFQSESGLIAATLFGVMLANIGITGVQELKRFKESLTVFLVSGLFIILAADLDPAVFGQLSLPIIGTTLAILFLVRPAAILLATIGDSTPWRERLLAAWIAPRGIVAAAVAGIAGTRLAGAGIPGAELILPMVFTVIAATVLLHGFTLRPLARRLGLVSVDRPGLLIVGAWSWSIGLAQKLRDLEVPVVIMDRSQRALAPARKAGLDAQRGDPLSEQAEDLELEGMDYVLAATDDDAYNALVCARFAPELGRERVHQLALKTAEDDAPSREWRGKIVANTELSRHSNGAVREAAWTFVTAPYGDPRTGLGEDGAGGDVQPLLAVRSDGGLVFLSPEQEVSLNPGDVIVSYARRTPRAES